MLPSTSARAALFSIGGKLHTAEISPIEVGASEGVRFIFLSLMCAMICRILAAAPKHATVVVQSAAGHRSIRRKIRESASHGKGYYGGWTSVEAAGTHLTWNVIVVQSKALDFDRCVIG